MKLLVFDFDGTLVDSKPLIEAGMEHALDGLGLPRALKEEWLKYVGLPVEEGIRRTFPLDQELTLDKVLTTYRTFPHQEREPMIRAFEGIPELLAELQGKGQRMAIATSKRLRGLNPTLERLAWGGYFDPVVTPDHVTHGKPHPESLEKILAATGVRAEDAFMVGDTPFDVEMAHAAKVPALAVGYGMYSGEALAEHHPRAYAPDVAALRDILLAWAAA